MPLEPHLLDYENTQFLIIGHKDDALEKAAKPADGEEQNAEKETPLEEMEKLEHEDEIRVEHLNGMLQPQRSESTNADYLQGTMLSSQTLGSVSRSTLRSRRRGEKATLSFVIYVLCLPVNIITQRRSWSGEAF